MYLASLVQDQNIHLHVIFTPVKRNKTHQGRAINKNINQKCFQINKGVYVTSSTPVLGLGPGIVWLDRRYLL